MKDSRRLLPNAYIPVHCKLYIIQTMQIPTYRKHAAANFIAQYVVIIYIIPATIQFLTPVAPHKALSIIILHKSHFSYIIIIYSGFSHNTFITFPCTCITPSSHHNCLYTSSLSGELKMVVVSIKCSGTRNNNFLRTCT